MKCKFTNDYVKNRNYTINRKLSQELRITIMKKSNVFFKLKLSRKK